MGREWFTYKVSRKLWSNFAGSAYEHAKTPYGRILRFWTRKGAEAYAAKLNRDAQP